MKSIAILIGLAGMASVAKAQLTTGSSGLTIKAGTPFYSQGLLLLPSADLLFQNDTIRLSTTAVTVGTGTSITRVYTVSPSVTVSGTLGIRYSAAELNGNQENTMSIVNAAPGAGFLGLTSLASSNGSYTVYSVGQNNVVLNRVTATSAGVPLAIRYHNFAAEAGNACSINLGWYADQAQPGNFRVERSQDGKKFRALAVTVSQAGERFSCIDPDPLPGRNIYRLAISETDKPVLYSAVATVDAPCARLSQMKIYPNPTSGLLTVALGNLPDGFATIELLDIAGKLIKRFHTNNQLSTLDLQGITPGSYFLKVQNGSSSESIKIVKL